MVSNKRKLAIRLAHLGSSLGTIAVATAIAIPTAAWAQAGTSTLRGHAAPGAQIVATETATGSTRRATAGADGTYVIPGLTAGNYHVTAGSQAADVIVPVASEQVQDFVAEAAAPKGGIVVTGRRPTADVHSSQVNQFVTLHDIAALPQTTRNFLEFADTVPGVQFSVDSNHNTSLRGGAQLASAVNVYIDGVSQKDLIGGGSGITGSAGNGGTGDPGNPFPQLAISEYQVVTSNYSAEYGDASSSVIIAQTKSGTNQFHAEGFGVFTNEKLRDKSPAEKFFHTKKAKAPDKQYGAAVSGPIIKNLAHFFLTWEHKTLSDQSVVSPDSRVSLAEAQALLPSDIASQYGPVTNPFTENLYFGKIDVEPTDSDRIEATGKLRIEHNLTGAGSGTGAASTRAPYVNNDKRADIRWQHSGNAWTNQILLSYQNTNSSTTSGDSTPQQQYVYFPNATANDPSIPLISVGGPGAGVGAISRQKGYTIQDDFTYTGLHLMGDHTLRLGGSFGSIKLHTQDSSADVGTATYYYAVTDTSVAQTPYYVQFPNVYEGFSGSDVKTTAKQYSAYIQDDWNVDRHLTLNLGVRWDHEVVPAFLHYQTPSQIVDAINGPFCTPDSPRQPCTTTQTYAEVLAEGNGSMPGYNINDYISTGHERKAPNNFSPRLGFSYDFGGNGKTVLFGGYARAYNRNQFRSLALEVTKIGVNNNPQVYFPSVNTKDDFGLCQTEADVNPANHCYEWDPKYLTPEGLATLATNPSSHEVDLLNNHLKTPHSDQFSLGIRNRLGDWNTQLTASYVASYDGLVGRFGNRYENGAYYLNGAQWNGSEGVPGIGTLILWDNAEKDRLFQIGLGAQKPYTKTSGWSATFAYTFSAGAQNNLAGSTNPYSIGNNQYIFDIPYPTDVPMLRATAVPRHRVVATYTRDLPWDMSMAAKVEVATPTSAAGIFGCPNGFPCGSYQGSVLYVSRPPNKTIGYKDVDLQLTKDFNFFRSASAYVRVDLLNVFNWANYDPGSAVDFPGYNAIPTYRKGGAIVGVPRTIKLSAGFKF
jgi:hypothetical protein